MRTRFILVTLVLALAAGCGDAPTPPAPAPAPAPASSPAGNRCAQLSQEVIDAYNRGDREAEEAAAAEFDRLAEAGQCG